MRASKHQQDPYVDDESDFDEEYFSRTYQPLSNLPTPPPSCQDSLAGQSPRSVLEQDELLDSALHGPAVHLVNLIPPTASLATPSVPTVHEMLTRANLPAATIALAVCILDSLNSRFSHHWRVACPSAQLHIDAVRPEVIILASLIIAHKFLEDSQEPTHRYARKWGGDAWTCEQINVTERCIMENLGYRILPLWDRELIEDALADMERAGRQAVLDLHRGEHKQHQPVMSSGKATLGLGMQLTPLETPESENLPRRPAGGGDGGALQVAFIRGPTQDFTLYPLEVLPGAKRDSFPSPPADEISSMG